MDTMTCTKFMFALTVCTYSMYPSVTGMLHIECTDTDTDTAAIPLTCSSNQMIHVISELYGRRTSEDNCGVVRDDSTAKLFESDSKGLIVSCNGRKSCIEPFACGIVCNGAGYAFEIAYKCVETCTEQTACEGNCNKGTGHAFEITYECVETKLYESHSNSLVVNCNGHKSCTVQTSCGVSCNNGTGYAYEIIYKCVENSQNICSSLHQTGSLPSLYLHSPGFPNSAGVEEKGNSCECTLSGQSLEVLMMQHRGWQGDFQITTTGADNKTWTSTYTNFNRVITSNVHSILVTYTNHPDRKFWVRISGNITSAACGNSLTSTTMTKITDTTTTDTETGTDFSTSYTTDKYVPSTTATVVRSTDFVSTSSTDESSLTREEENTTVMTVSAVCGAIIFLLIVIIGLLVYFKVIKPQRKNNTDNRVINNEPDFENANGSNEARNTYSDLVRYENQDNDYGKLHLYANPDFESEESKKGKRK